MSRHLLHTMVLLALLGIVGCATAEERSGDASAAAEANLKLGVAYLRQDRLELAQEKLGKALQQNPRNPQVHSALAVLNERLGKPSRVDSHYRAALRLAPDDPEIQNNYAVYLCQSGRVREGVKRFEQAASNALYRTPETAYTNAGVCLRSGKHLEEAERSFMRALNIRPGYAEASFQLGDLYLEQGKAEEARRRVEAHLSAFDPTPDLLLLGVRVSRTIGDRLAQERYARRLRMDFPDSEQARALAALSGNPG